MKYIVTYKIHTVKNLVLTTEIYPKRDFRIWGCGLYTTICSEKLFPRRPTRWYRYLRRYWLGSSSAYPTCCIDFGTISLVYLCMNVFVLLFYI